MKNNAQLLGVDEDSAVSAQREIENNAGSLGEGVAFIIIGYPGAGKTTAADEVQAELEKKGDSVLRLKGNEYDSAIEVDSLAVIEEVVSLEEIVSISQFFDDLCLIYIEAHHAARHNRLIERAKESDEIPMQIVSRDVLRKRDEEAASSGLNVIENERFFDRKVTNETLDKSEFEQFIRHVTHDLYQDCVYSS